MAACQFFLFGDQTIPFEEELLTLVHVKQNETLQSFLEKTCFALREEIGALPDHQQEWFPRFTTMVDLLSKLGETEGTPVLKFTLLCITELGLFIRLFEGSRPYPAPSNSYLLGPCTGSFAAAAVSVSQTLSQLIPAGVEAVLVAFKTALRALSARDDIARTPAGGPSTWSAVASWSEEKAVELIDNFCAQRSLPHASRPYISAVLPTNVVISGPPACLADFFSASSCKPYYMPIELPYHAQHIFSHADVKEITASPRDEKIRSLKPHFTLFSASSGSKVDADHYTGILANMVFDTLCAQLRWDNILKNVPGQALDGERFEKCTIYPFSSQGGSLLSSGLGRYNNKVEVAIDNLVDATKPSPIKPAGKFEHSRIAIIGFSGRFPDAASNEEFWELLRAGRDVHRTIPEDRFDWKAHFDATGKTKNTSRIQYGCFIKEPGVFDTRFFNMSPRESENTDPAQRLAISTAYEALEMAGFVPNRTPSSQQDRIGVFYGVTSDDWREVNSGQNVDTYFIPGGNRAFIPGRISYFFRFSGPSLSMDTACSSSFAAIQTACAYLWRGECDTVVAGGANILTNPDNFAGLDRGHFLSTTGNCNAFDDGASGYCRADAVGTVILKRYEDALADNDPIFGIIAGATTNHCGQTESITRPHEGDQASVFKRIMRGVGMNPLNVSYVEMHGTGTQAGDATEMNSVLSVFVPGRERNPHHPLYLGSAKANIGHAESASGVSSLIKVLMMLKNNEIPPHCGIKTKINRNYPLDLKERNVNIAFEPTPWHRKEGENGARTIFLNNFSAAGGNTAVLLQEAPLRQVEAINDPRTSHLVAVTGKSAKSLRGNIQSLVSFLKNNPAISLPALSYTTTARRMHYNYRAMCFGSTIKEVVEKFGSKLSEEAFQPIPSPSKMPSVAFAFTGQGALYTGLGIQLFQSFSRFKTDILKFNAIAKQEGFPGFLSLVDGSISAVEDVEPIVAQLALVCVQMALYRLWVSWGVKPSAVIGHSLGEYPALYAAGVISATEVIFLVGTRAQLLTQHCTKQSHAMLAVKASLEGIEPYLKGSGCEIACYNQPTSHVVSGTCEDISSLSSVLQRHGLECVRLDVPFAFHSSQMDAVLEPFESAAKSVRYEKPVVPYISPLLGRAISDGTTLGASYLAEACRKSVNFQLAIQEARNSAVISDKTMWVEVGPHSVCSGMLKGTLGSQILTLPSLKKNTDTYKVLTSGLKDLYLSGLNIQWNEYHRGFKGCHEVLELPRYSWDLKNYWIQYKNNFCLTKGEGTVQPNAVAPPPPPSPEPEHISPAVQKVVEESHSADISKLLIESDIQNPDLLPIFHGHKVNGTSLCPSSLYADIAMTMTRYMLKNIKRDTNTTGINVSNMLVEKPMIASSSGTPQLFRVSATAQWPIGVVSFEIYSVNNSGKKTAAHATCQAIITENHKWAQDWQRRSRLIRTRIESLRQGLDGGESNKLKRGMVYKLFSSIVDYDASYQGMQEVILDSKALEATASVSFQVGDCGFYFNARWIDSLGHLAGFVMNGNDYVHSQNKDHVFINHGWERMRCATTFQMGKTYQIYNNMQLTEGTTYVGDTYILEDGQVVAIFEGIKFQGIPRRILNTVLPPNGSQAKPSPSSPPEKVIQKQVARPAASPERAVPIRQREQPQTQKIRLRARRTTKTTPDGVAPKVLKIISEEAGVDLVELEAGGTEFADYGIDSLLSLNICSKIREELGLDLPSSIFAECPTVKDLVGRLGDSSPATPDSASTSSACSTPASLGLLSSASGADYDPLALDSDDTGVSSASESEDVIEAIRKIIAEETGVAIAEVTYTSPFSELGLDSLLSLTIAGKIGEDLDFELPKNVFNENENLNEVRQALGLSKPSKPNARGKATAPAPKPTVSPDPKWPRATSVLLQGNPKTASKIVFLFPDGSGSATSYATLASVSPNVAIFGLNCPWMKTPEQMTCTFEQLSAIYLTEIRKRQPRGPYYFGGWSAGGIQAYEAAQQLVSTGEETAKLILIDSPNPIGLENPPERMYDFFESLDFFGMSGQQAPSWLRPHFNAFLTLLDNYKIESFAGERLDTYIIYAKDGICKHPGDPRPEVRPDDPREMLWLLNNRTDFSGSGWAQLVGKQNLNIEVLEDVNHFSMVAPGPKAEDLGRFLRRVLC